MPFAVKWLLAALSISAIVGCQGADTRGQPIPEDSDTGSDTGTDTDADADTDPDTDSDTGSDADGGLVDFSYIWIANSAEGTLSKVNTITEVEVGRFRTCPVAHCDPSRTSVNLAGDMAVTNRNPGSGGTPSSVVKFAATPERCIDRNDNGVIDTSTGPTDVLPWGEDECMIWSTPMPVIGGDPSTAAGARATAWDGTEDPDTGVGGHVWVGMCSGMIDAMAYKLDGDTGEIVASVELPTTCAYGGAMDGTNGFWIYDTMGRLVRVNTNSLSTFQRDVSCGYGITVDSQGRVWTGGAGGIGSCVSRYDLNVDAEETMDVPGAEFLRGIAVGVGLSAGYAWAADTSGRLYKLDEETMLVSGPYAVGANNMIGVAVDFEGYVWTVSSDGNSTYKFDPVTETFITVPIGLGPYTYSDMTGAQLKNAVDPPE